MQRSSVSPFTSIVIRPDVIGVVVLLAGSVFAGCNIPDPLQGGDHPFVTEGGGASGASGTADGSGVGGGAGEGGGSRGATPVGVCPAFHLSSSFELARAAPGQRYVRCQTLGPEADWRGLVIASDGQHIAARTGGGTVRLIATHPWREVAQIASPLGVLDAAAFSPDGRTLAVASAEMGEVTTWRAADGARISSAAAQPASTIDATASSLAYSQDGRRLATSLGVVIDASGAVTSWKTGTPINASLMPNPANLGLGEAVPTITFTAGDTTLFVDYKDERSRA